MTKQKSTKRALLMSGLALIMCIAMLAGSTFAWFTDSVTSAGNIIKSGTLKVDLVDKERVEEAKRVMKTLNDKEELIQVLDNDNDEISAFVADDNGEKCSVVSAPIIVGGNKLASIGVFGPQKMDYMGIASALKVVVDELNKDKGE